MQIISDVEAILNVLAIKGRFAVYVGAGVSAEAQVMTAWGICEEIREKLQPLYLPGSPSPKAVEHWQNETLKWNEPSKRYAVCIKKGYTAPAARVDFFRNKLRGKKPSFSHHAIAMLMTNSYLKSTCVTTNFDKLLESAFIQQGRAECQAIRNEAETQYWRNDPERRYALKLHGDYDTYNILNTAEETISISENMVSKVRDLLQDTGLLVLGTAGQEKSIYSLFDDLGTAVEKARGAAGSILSYGLLWGIYMGMQKPEGLTEEDLKELVRSRIKGGGIGEDIVDMMERLEHVGSFRFFPVWGANAFLLNLINATNDKSLQAAAELYLDHEMRLRHIFRRKGLPQDAIDKHLTSLDQEKKKLDKRQRSPYPEAAFRVTGAGPSVEIRILYGDISKRSYMDDKEFRARRRAIVSPEDTFLSAGGGVAVRLLEKAGPLFMLNELGKFAPIEQGTVAVTSGGNLPLQYVFHAASIEIQNDGSYTASEESVYKTMTEVLEKAETLSVEVLWVPLLGAGVASLGPRQSLEGILQAISSCKGRWCPTILIFIYREKVLDRRAVRECLEGKLGSGCSIEVL